MESQSEKHARWLRVMREHLKNKPKSGKKEKKPNRKRTPLQGAKMAMLMGSHNA